MGPNSIFHSHCSARTQPFESHFAAKHPLWNIGYLSVLYLKPLVWYSIWIEILLRLISETSEMRQCADNQGWITNQAKQATALRAQTHRAPKGGSLWVDWFVLIWLSITLFANIHYSRIQKPGHSEKEEAGVKGMVWHFVKTALICLTALSYLSVKYGARSRR